jgi:hypothetical protein
MAARSKAFPTEREDEEISVHVCGSRSNPAKAYFRKNNIEFGADDFNGMVSMFIKSGYVLFVRCIGTI